MHRFGTSGVASRWLLCLYDCHIKFSEPASSLSPFCCPTVLTTHRSNSYKVVSLTSVIHRVGLSLFPDNLLSWYTMLVTFCYFCLQLGFCWSSDLFNRHCFARHKGINSLEAYKPTTHKCVGNDSVCLVSLLWNTGTFSCASGGVSSEAGK